MKPLRVRSSENQRHRLSWELSPLQTPGPHPVPLHLQLHPLPPRRDPVLPELHRVGVQAPWQISLPLLISLGPAPPPGTWGLTGLLC